MQSGKSWSYWLFTKITKHCGKYMYLFISSLALPYPTDKFSWSVYNRRDTTSTLSFYFLVLFFKYRRNKAMVMEMMMTTMKVIVALRNSRGTFVFSSKETTHNYQGLMKVQNSSPPLFPRLSLSPSPFPSIFLPFLVLLPQPSFPILSPPLSSLPCPPILSLPSLPSPRSKAPI